MRVPSLSGDYAYISWTWLWFLHDLNCNLVNRDTRAPQILIYFNWPWPAGGLCPFKPFWAWGKSLGRWGQNVNSAPWELKGANPPELLLLVCSWSLFSFQPFFFLSCVFSNKPWGCCEFSWLVCSKKKGEEKKTGSGSRAITWSHVPGDAMMGCVFAVSDWTMRDVARWESRVG